MSETTGEGPMHVIYVSPAGDDRWSGRLAEANADRSDGPMASVEGVVRSLWQGGKGKKGGMARAGLRGPGEGGGGGAGGGGVGGGGGRWGGGGGCTG